MAKIVLLAVIVFIAYSVVKKRVPKKPDRKHEEYMVKCAECGVYHPKSESVASGGRFFCCEEHRRSHEHA